ncbi:MAG TPA: DUF4260 domain-containing protein [Caulobacteraceae bacterium]|jgi:hypothetical protein
MTVQATFAPIRLTAPAMAREPFTRGAAGGVRSVLRIEAATILIAAVWAYSRFDLGWPMFALLFLLPDLSMLGYLAGKRFGAASYNLAHSYATPAALAGIALASHVRAALPILLIWVAHIAFDRLLGYGLKYVTTFGDTHLGRVGKD